MEFVIQKEENGMKIEKEVLKEILNRGHLVHEYKYISIEDIPFLNQHVRKEIIPIGSINFVRAWLKRMHGIEKMTPIEIPEVLREKKYLCRGYKIVPKDELPDNGSYFIKHADTLKLFSNIGEMPDKDILPDGHYVLSEIKMIVSEWRVMVMDDEILGIQFYNGDPLIFPSRREVIKIREMVLKYMFDKERPRAYSMDVAVINDQGMKHGHDLMLIEVHPFVSLGLYGFYSEKLPWMYQFGFNYYLKGEKHEKKTNS